MEPEVMDEKRLGELEQLAAGATDGPWYVAGLDDSYAQEMGHTLGIGLHPDGHSDEIVRTDGGVYPPLRDDARFIAAARTVVPELVAEVRRLRAELEASAPVNHVRAEALREERRAERVRCLALVRGLAPDCDAIAAAIGDYPD